MNSGNLTARHLEWVANELDEWCAPLRLTLEPSSVIVVLRRPRQPRGAQAPHARAARGPRAVPRHAAAARAPDAERRRDRAEDPPPAALRQDAAAQRAARVCWPSSPRRSTPSSARSRAAASAPPRSASSTRSSASRASRATCARRSAIRCRASTPGKSYGGTMELAVFGRARNEDDRRRELARRRLTSWGAAGGPWEVKDISQTGFRLVAPMSAASRSRSTRSPAIRRTRPRVLDARHRAAHEAPLTPDRAEIGLQVIANTLIGVELVEQRKQRRRRRLLGRRRARPRSTGACSRGLFLALRKREGDTAVQSLIVPAVEYQPTRRFRLDTSQLDRADPLRAPDRAAARLGVGGGRAARPRQRDVHRRPRSRRAWDAAGPAAHDPRRAEYPSRRDRPLRRDLRRVPLERARAFNIAHACCRRWAGDRARLALHWEDESGETAAFTFWDLEQRARRLANALAALGVARGDRVALILPQRPETVIAYSRCYQMGAIAVPLSFLFGPDALEYRLAEQRREGRDRRSAVAAEPRADPRAPARARARDRRRRRARGGRARCGRTLLARASRGIRDRCRRAPTDPALHHLHQRHHRAAEGRADAALRACSATCPASSIRTTAFRARATSSGRRRTGRGPAA